MSQSVTLNSSSYTIPDVGENDWGQNVTDFLVAIPGAVLQKSGGAFTLTADVDFGANFGLKSIYYKSRSANPATIGTLRLGVSEVVSWRNNANGANLSLGIDASDLLTYDGSRVVTVAGGFTFVGTNIYANQKGIRFLEQTANGTNYIEIVAPDAVTASVTFKLPDGVGSAGQVLSTDGTGVLSWIAAAGGGTVNTGTQGRLALYSATGTTIDDVVTMTNTVSLAIAAHGQGSVYTIPDSGAATANFVLTEGNVSQAAVRTFTGTVILSNGNTAVLNISANTTFKVDSTNALVSIGTATMTYPLYISKSSAGATITSAIENSESANGASHARLYVITGGASGGDPYINLYNGVQNYSIGLDNSDSDALCVTGASTLNGTNLLRLTTAGALTVASTLTVTAGGLTVTAGGATITAGGLLLSADAVTVAATSNQIILGTTRTVTITAPTPASASRTHTIPDVGADSSFVMLAGSQAITGAKTFASSTLLLQEVSSTDVITIAVAALAAGLTYTLPDAGGAASFVMTAGNQTIAGTKTFSASAIISDATTSDLYLKIQHNNATADPLIWLLTNATDYVHGLDNSDSDKFKQCASTALGTSTLTTLTMTGKFGIGNETPESFNSALNTLVVLGGLTEIASASNGTNYLGFTDAVGTTVQGLIQYNHNASAGAETMDFRVGGQDSFEINGNGHVKPLLSAGTQNFGDGTNYWGDISYKTLTDRGCLPWCDDGVEVKNEKGEIERVSDVKALLRIKKHKTRKTPTGLPRLDYDTFPVHALRRAENEFEKVERDENGDAWVVEEVRRLKDDGSVDIQKVRKQAQDGIEMTMMFGVFIGAFKEVNSEIDELKAKVTDLNQRIETLEKAA